MPDYKTMYYTAMRKMEQAINLLIEAQRTCEEIYLLSEEDTPTADEIKNP